MALPSTLLHFDLAVSHADTGVHHAASFKLARHPSETLERAWLRVLALAWRWREGLGFGPGLCEPDAPDLVARGPDGRASAIVRVGKPDPARVERDVNQNAGAEVAVLFESPRRLDGFLEEARAAGLSRLSRAELAAVEPPLLRALAERDERRFRASVTLVSEHLYVELDGQMLEGPLVRRSY